MVIEVLYKSFRYEKFDSSAQTNSEPFRAKERTSLPTGTSTSVPLRKTASFSQSTGMTEIRSTQAGR